jgi:hypothetical protein
MFDQTPAPTNLPVEPEAAKTVPPPRTPVAPPVPPAPPSMRGGIMNPLQHEPEDILSSVGSEGDEAAQEKELMTMDGTVPSGGNDGKLRLIMIILSCVAGLLLLVVGGLFVYRAYFSSDRTTQPTTIPPVLTPSSSTGATIPQGGEMNSPSPAASETLPVVEPTPVPDIPKPEPVGATSSQALDTDGDGISDAEEARLRTDPNNADTDGDTLADGEEIKLGTDPLIADTDGDGLSDGDEVKLWKTDPKQADTDGDGFSDGQEVRSGYNPLGSGKLPPIQ